MSVLLVFFEGGVAEGFVLLTGNPLGSTLLGRAFDAHPVFGTRNRAANDALGLPWDRTAELRGICRSVTAARLRGRAMDRVARRVAHGVLGARLLALQASDLPALIALPAVANASVYERWGYRPFVAPRDGEYVLLWEPCFTEEDAAGNRAVPLMPFVVDLLPEEGEREGERQGEGEGDGEGERLAVAEPCAWCVGGGLGVAVRAAREVSAAAFTVGGGSSNGGGCLADY